MLKATDHLSHALRAMLAAIQVGDVDIAHHSDSEHDAERLLHPVAYLRQNHTKFAEIVRNVVDPQLLPLRGRVIDAMIDPRRTPDFLSLASRAVRWQAHKILRELLRSMWFDASARQRRWYWLTMFDDRGNALEYAPVIELHRCKARFRKALAATGLDAMAVLELQAGTNFPRYGMGGTLMLHAHAIGFTDDPDFDIAQAEAAGVQAGGLINWLGAKPVQIAEVDSWAALGRHAAYMCKLPISGGYLGPNPASPSGMSLHKTLVRPTMAVRVLEALSHMTFQEAVWSVGQGNLIRTPLMAQLRDWYRRRASVVAVDQTHIAATYRRFWQTAPIQSDRQPVDVRYDTQLPADAAWQAAIDVYQGYEERKRTIRDQPRPQRLSVGLTSTAVRPTDSR